MPLYFAYGSNLHAAQMRQRCPSAVAIGRATLHRHVLAFVGHSTSWDGAVATVQPGNGSVQGMLWDVSADDMEVLDLFEGSPTAYLRRSMEVLDYRRQPATAFVYEARSQTRGVPSDRYVEQIARGMKAFGLDTDRLAAAVQKSGRSHRAAPPQEPTGNRTRVFVYGTLRLGGDNHHRFLGRPPLRVATTSPGFALHDLGAFPAMTRDGGRGRVAGEVYEVSPDELAELDRLEGVPRLYERESVLLDDGTEADAYLMPAGRVVQRPTIPSGDWMRRGAADGASA